MWSSYCRKTSGAHVQRLVIKCTCCIHCVIQPCSYEVTSADQQVVRDLMESVYRLVHCLPSEFIGTFNWSSFVTGLDSCDLTVKWLVDVCVS